METKQTYFAESNNNNYRMIIARNIHDAIAQVAHDDVAIYHESECVYSEELNNYAGYDASAILENEKWEILEIHQTLN